MRITKRLRKGAKALATLAAGLLLFGAAACSHDSGGGSSGGGGDDETEDQGTPLDNTFEFDGYEFEVVSGSAVKYDDGSVGVNEPSEGIAIRLTKAQTDKLEVSATTGFYVQAELLPTKKGSGANKNFGPAGLISSDSKKFSYAGVNYNGRIQLGEISTKSTDGKGEQFDNLISEKSYLYVESGWTEPYILRYEYKEGAIYGYINGIQFNKSGTKSYDLEDDFSAYESLAGIYTNADSFTMTSFKVGSLDSGKSALKISADKGDFVTLSENTTKYIFLMNPSLKVRVGDEAITYTVQAFGDNGAETDFEVVSSDDSVVKVEKTEDGFTASPEKEGKATVTVTAGDAKRVFSYTVEKALSYVDTDYGAVTLLPAAGAESVFEDEHLEITFDNTPELVEGIIVIYEKGNTGSPVDTITVGSDKDTVNGTTYTLKNFMVQVIDRTVFIKPHRGKLQNGKTYVVGIPDGVITGTLGDKAFTGFNPNSENPQWSFTVRDVHSPNTSSLKVAATGEADYRTVQSALEKAANGATITVAKGVYREIINYSGSSTSVTIVGDTETTYGEDVIIQGINCNSWNGSSDTRAAFRWGGKDLTLKHITIQNAYDRNTMGGTAQSEALYFNSASGKLVAYDCSFLGQQDTLLTKGKNWFYKCYIVGDTDFIWGYADVALFEECKLNILNTAKNAPGINESTDGAYIFETRVAQGKTKDDTAKIGKGYVLFNSNVTTERDDAYLARRASPIKGSPSEDYYDQVAVIDTTFSKLNAQLWGGPNVKSNKNTPLYDKDNDNMHVGWKIYGGSGYDKTKVDSQAYFGTITETVYNAEYSGRNVILNRVYNKASKSYVAASDRWDVSALADEFKASPDKSLELAGEDTDSGETSVTYDFTDEGLLKGSDATLTQSGFNQNKTYALGNVGATLTFWIVGDCKITVSGYYSGGATVTHGSSSASYTIATQGEYNSAVLSLTGISSEGEKVTVEATAANTYITSIDVQYTTNVDAAWAALKAKLANATTMYDFTAAFDTWLTSNYSGQMTQSEGNVTYSGATLSVTTSGGNFKYDSSNGCMVTTGGQIVIPVTGACKVTVTSHSFNSNYISINGQSGTSGTSLTYDYTGGAGNITIVSSDTSKAIYIYSVKVELSL